jgi:U8 snoRNA-decapping enzyme
LWEIDLKASVLMQFRFDGYIGFPGGFIDPSDKTWEDGLNRELKEELNLNEKFYINRSDYQFSAINKVKNLALHFYTKEVSYENFKAIELEAMNSGDFGTEVMGMIRPTLYSMPNGRGLSIFLSHEFVGNSLIQFLKGLLYLKILSCNEILDAIQKIDNK